MKILFVIELHINDRGILLAIHKYFKGIGTVSYPKNRPSVVRYEVSKCKDILNVLVAHLNLYPLQSSK